MASAHRALQCSLPWRCASSVSHGLYAGKLSTFNVTWPKVASVHMTPRCGISWRHASSVSQSRFDVDPRLQGVEASQQEAAVSTLNQLLFVLRVSEKLQDYLESLMEDRLFDNNALMEHLRIPIFAEGQLEFGNKPLHWKTMPKATAYIEIKRQTYWATLHAWLLHCKSKDAIASSGPMGTATGVLMTKSVFNWQWDQVRFWMYCADVPGMSLKAELEHFQGFMFDFCTKLDDIWEEEAPEGTAKALAPGSGSSLGPRLQKALKENIYEFNQVAGGEDDFIYELTVYLLRQKLALEALPAEAFLGCGFGWADFAWG